MPASECPWWCNGNCGGVDHFAFSDLDARWSFLRLSNSSGADPWGIGIAPGSSAQGAEVLLDVHDNEIPDDRPMDTEIGAVLTADEALHMAYKILDARFAAMHSIGDPAGHLQTPDDAGSHGPIGETEAQVLGLLSLLVETRGIATTHSSTEAPA